MSDCPFRTNDCIILSTSSSPACSEQASWYRPSGFEGQPRVLMAGRVRVDSTPIGTGRLRPPDGLGRGRHGSERPGREDPAIPAAAVIITAVTGDQRRAEDECYHCRPHDSTVASDITPRRQPRSIGRSKAKRRALAAAPTSWFVAKITLSMSASPCSSVLLAHWYHWPITLTVTATSASTAG
jgi:hypothetical protein